ncbi:IQ motif and SEC7 domain-containing protein 1 isoform X5 [Nilaparvata lugens]|uniref:IQ motif and SEC7 domain-containing protein 1 isoform X5 n=1 Tax=Nilaparvata lugens TaxID=108931 RepID=UPI00193E26AE|nr:IQ motif and SEC7 domain-containing protein 1 isoform X5 [Nilaparvata lugens]
MSVESDFKTSNINTNTTTNHQCESQVSLSDDEKSLINKQQQEIEELKNKLESVMSERNMLLCEVSRLKFELEIADLKRIHDDRGGTFVKERNHHQGYINGNMHGSKESDDANDLSMPPSNVFPCHMWSSQGLMKKGSVRNNGDVLKRSRVQSNVYELSQDLLDKQIELLERKYGGVKARNAALTIQRAFRHYTLLKKFAAITAMAKAEKRLSRRLVGFAEDESSNSAGTGASETPPQHHPMPVRSMSMRERERAPPTTTPLNSSSSLSRSHSGRCDLTYYCEYSPQDIFTEINKEGCVKMMGDHNVSSDSCHLSQPQRYCSQNNSRSRIPPEVPKRTSSISLHSTSPALARTSDSGSLSSVQSSGSDTTIAAAHHPPNWNKKIQVSETLRKRQYRVGLNLFNKKPERGISYLVRRGFLENSPQGVARFLISRKGLSKQMIGEYLGNLQNPFNNATLDCFAQELDLSGMQVDVALRKFQTFFRMPGEAQKIERLMEVFSHRYCHCNRDVVARLRNLDTVFVLAFAIIMLNTDLHTPNLKPERRMKLEDFIKNLRGVDDCCDVDRDMLIGIYERVKANEFKPGSDHVTQVLKVQSTIVGKKPNLALPHRRLVCYCRLYEVADIYKKERSVHQREVFLFNDLLVITKILSKKKNSVTYTFRQSFSLSGLVVSLFEVAYYPFGIRLSQRVDSRNLITFNARNDHDRCKFAEDIRESISEMDEMENLRIEAELERQKSSRGGRSSGGGSENRDSGVADVGEVVCEATPTATPPAPPQLKRSALSNSLLDIHDQFVGSAEKQKQRRGSAGSLDSSSATGTKQQSSSFLGSLFAKRERKLSKASVACSEDLLAATQV